MEGYLEMVGGLRRVGVISFLLNGLLKTTLKTQEPQVKTMKVVVGG